MASLLALHSRDESARRRARVAGGEPILEFSMKILQIGVRVQSASDPAAQSAMFCQSVA